MSEGFVGNVIYGGVIWERIISSLVCERKVVGDIYIVM